jgi:signal transduction histidine kinase
MWNRFSRLPLFWKTLLSTSAAITVLFAVTGWMVRANTFRLTAQSLHDEVRSSFQAYESLWRARSEMLAAISRVLSRMPDVRAAFSTGDSATIRDSAGEIWAAVSQENAIFLVTDPRGSVIASLGGEAGAAGIRDVPEVRTAAQHFPNQATGFMVEGGRLFQVAITPVYVGSPRGPALIDVLVAGYAVDGSVAERLKNATGGSDFVFLTGGQVVASSLPGMALPAPDSPQTTSALFTPLLAIDGKPLGELRIYRSFEAARQHLATLGRNLFWIWMLAVAAGLLFSYILARRIVQPVKKLDLAAAEIARGNYAYRVEVDSQSEFGRLARTFNQMCASLESARDELIRQERIATIARLSTSLVHDLRNPLAAIYGGAEMLVDSSLSENQVKRLASNIYRSSRRIQELLQELVNVARGGHETREPHRLAEIIAGAVDAHAEAARAQLVTIDVSVPPEVEITAERARLERVFANLIHNAIEAMPTGGQVSICAERDKNGAVLVTVQDTGPGISPEIASHLFQPFATAGKRNGLGLGLALARQTLLEHGGDLWAEAPKKGHGACFRLRLPVTAPVAA